MVELRAIFSSLFAIPRNARNAEIPSQVHTPVPTWKPLSLNYRGYGHIRTQIQHLKRCGRGSTIIWESRSALLEYFTVKSCIPAVESPSCTYFSTCKLAQLLSLQQRPGARSSKEILRSQQHTRHYLLRLFFALVHVVLRIF